PVRTHGCGRRPRATLRGGPSGRLVRGDAGFPGCPGRHGGRGRDRAMGWLNVMRFSGRVGIAACVVGLAVPAALAQLRAEVDLKEIAARTLARIASIDLRSNPDPQPQDFETAAVVLGLAQELQPKDTG